MPVTKALLVKSLSLDLSNFRMPKQANELAAVRSMISVNQEWFYALAASILDDGYHITENILILKSGAKPATYSVKEGNRRVAILKLAIGYIRRNTLDLPADLEEKFANVTDKWKRANKRVPCAIYKASDVEVVDRIVTLTHGKGERAGRDKWKPVARARHNRAMNGASEPALDLLESYLKHGGNLTPHQKEQWGGDYPLSVLDEAIKKLAPRFEATSSRDMVKKYPNSIKHKRGLESMLHDIGQETFGFSDLRDKTKDVVLTKYGIPAIDPTGNGSGGGGGQAGGAAGGSSKGGTGSGAGGGGSTGGTQGSGKPNAAPITSQAAVTDALKGFHPKGNNRGKVVSLLDELKGLKIVKFPHAFCFVLRSMFEISAKAYCLDHAGTPGAPKATKQNGEDRSLVDVLRDVTTHLTKNNTDKAMKKELHGAMTELALPDGFLSVTSLNQLIHSTHFSVDERHICKLFANIFPLLRQMNV